MIATMARLFVEGGAFMWLILGVLAVATAVIVERLYYYLRVCRHDPADLLASTVKALNAGEPETALRAVSGGGGPMNAILAAAVERYRDGHALEEIRQVVEEVAISETPRLQHRLGYLATCANVSTLSGLLGTIFGLQKSFSSLAAATATEKAALLSAGIAQAMNTTAFGLIVAIFCMIAHARLASLQTRRLDDLDVGIVRLLNFLQTRCQTATPPKTRIAA